MRCLRETVQSKALYFEQKAAVRIRVPGTDPVYAEQERGKVHPVVFELIGKQESWQKGWLQGLCGHGRRRRTAENAKELLPYA